MGRTAVKITADTNVLVRAATLDDPAQSRLAQRLIKEAENVAVTLPTLCEFCWVLRRAYNLDAAQIAGSIRLLIQSGNVSVDEPAVEAGLAMLDQGGDFADGVIAHEGKWLDGDIFMSFDKTAVRLLTAQGFDARVPA